MLKRNRAATRFSESRRKISAAAAFRKGMVNMAEHMEKMGDSSKFFLRAKPVFLTGLEQIPNIQAGFRQDVVFEKLPERAVFRVTARSFYRLYVNGVMVMHGPARTAEGYLRVDAFDAAAYFHAGANAVAFELISCAEGFQKRSNDITCEPGVLRAELEADGSIVLATDESWRGIHLKQRHARSERISHCRQNTEIYDLDERYTLWRTCPAGAIQWDRVSEVPWNAVLLERGMLLPELKKIASARLVEFGSAYIDETIPVAPTFFEAGMTEYFDTLPERPRHDYLRTVETPLKGRADYIDGGICAEGTDSDSSLYLHFDFGQLHLGFIGFTVTCDRAGVLDIVHLETYVLYDRKSENTAGANPCTRLHLKPGTYTFLTMEPALTRYLKFYFRPSEKAAEAPPVRVTLTDIHLRTYSYPDLGQGAFQCSDDDVNRLYEAARRTLLLNTLDIFMDCPERERGGWLCDSLWTARAARIMLGDQKVERAFLENFLLFPAEKIWHAFFPETYPAHRPDYDTCPGITTWSFWLMAELCEYAERSGDTAFLEKYRKRVTAFVEGSQELIGASGLLENLPFVFIDWSLSNNPEYHQPISTAANALYAYMLIRLGEAYHVEAWAEQGRQMQTVMKNVLVSLDPFAIMPDPGIADSMTYENGQLHKRGFYSESCQYTAMWAGLYAPDEIPAITEEIVHRMGPDPTCAPRPYIGRAGLFIGLCIRLDMLARLGEYEKLFSDIKAIYGPQLREGPGTLWENEIIDTSSRCHGFTAHTGVHLTRDILGLGIPDELHKTVTIAPHPCGLRWARGTVSTSCGSISLFWTAEKHHLRIRLSLPEAFRADIRVPEGYEAVIDRI